MKLPPHNNVPPQVNCPEYHSRNWIPRQWELCNQSDIGGPLRWGTNDNYVSKVKLGDLWDGGPMRTVYPYRIALRGSMRNGSNGSHWGTNEMRTNENCVTRVTLGDQWVEGTNGMGDQWNGWCMGANWRPMRWGSEELGDQTDGTMMAWLIKRGTNERGDQWEWGPVNGFQTTWAELSVNTVSFGSRLLGACFSTVQDGDRNNPLPGSQHSKQGNVWWNNEHRTVPQNVKCKCIFKLCVQCYRNVVMKTI